MVVINKNTIIAVALLGLLIFLGFADTSSIISGQGLEPETRAEVWNGIDVEISSGYFGTLVSAPSVKISSNPSVFEHYEFCGDNDGRLTISNTYSVGEALVLRSSMSGSDRGCNDENYLDASFTAPKGKMVVQYTFTGTESKSDGSGGSVDFNGETAMFKFQECCGIAQGSSKQGTIEKEFASETKVDIKIRSFHGYTGSGSADIRVYFYPEVEEIVEEETPQEETTSTSTTVPIVFTGTTQQSTEELSFIDKFNAWVENFFNSIFGIFG